MNWIYFSPSFRECFPYIISVAARFNLNEFYLFFLSPSFWWPPPPGLSKTLQIWRQRCSGINAVWFAQLTGPSAEVRLVPPIWQPVLTAEMGRPYSRLRSHSPSFCSLLVQTLCLLHFSICAPPRSAQVLREPEVSAWAHLPRIFIANPPQLTALHTGILWMFDFMKEVAIRQSWETKMPYSRILQISGSPMACIVPRFLFAGELKVQEWRQSAWFYYLPLLGPQKSFSSSF